MKVVLRLVWRLLEVAAFLGFTVYAIGGPASTAGCAISLALYAALALRMALRWLNRPLVDGR